jgi:hypothetical protein
MVKNKVEKRLTIGSECVLQRWQIYTNIALLQRVIVGIRRMAIRTKYGRVLFSSTVFFTSKFYKFDEFIND